MKYETLIKYGKSIVPNQINETVLTTIIMEHWFTLDKKYDTIPETRELWFTIEITMAPYKKTMQAELWWKKYVPIPKNMVL